MGSWKYRQKLVYKDSLDMVVASVEGQELTLRDFAVYVAYEEATVHEQAVIYNPEDTNEYWGLHTDGKFITYAARDAAIAMAIHDELFYQLSQELNLTFSEEEMQILNNDVNDFWDDLLDEDKHLKLGISKEEVYDSMYKIACAQKCQGIYAQMAGVAYEDYEIEQEEYLDFLSDYDYEIYEDVLERIDFGDVTLEHE